MSQEKLQTMVMETSWGGGGGGGVIEVYYGIVQVVNRLKSSSFNPDKQYIYKYLKKKT